jgi:hypothetical protein
MKTTNTKRTGDKVSSLEDAIESLSDNGVKKGHIVETAKRKKIVF